MATGSLQRAHCRGEGSRTRCWAGSTQGVTAISGEAGDAVALEAPSVS